MERDKTQLISLIIIKLFNKFKDILIILHSDFQYFLYSSYLFLWNKLLYRIKI